MADNRILGGFLLGLGGGIEAFSAAKQDAADKKRQDQLFEIQLNDAKIDAESSRLRLQLLQEDVRRNPGNLDMQRQLNEATLSLRQSQAAVAEAELGEIGQRQEGRLLDIAAKRQAGKEDLLRDIQNQLGPLQRQLSEASDLLNLGAAFAPEEASRLRAAINISPRDARARGIDGVISEINDDMQVFSSFASEGLGFTIPESLNRTSFAQLKGLHDRKKNNLALADAALEDRNKILTDQINALQALSAEQVGPQADADRKEADRLGFELRNNMSNRREIQNDIAGAVLGANGDPLIVEEAELDAGARADEAAAQPGRGAGRFLQKLGGQPVPGAEAPTGSVSPVNDFVALARSLAPGGPGEARAWAADKAQLAAGVITKEEARTRSAMRTIGRSLKNAPGTVFGGAPSGLLEQTLARPIRSLLDVFNIPPGPLSEENLLSPERFAQALKDGIKDPTTGRIVLPSEDGFSFEADALTKEIVLETMTPGQREFHESLDEDSQRANILVAGYSMGLGFQSLSPAAGTPDRPKRIGEGGVKNALAFMPGGLQGSFNNDTWVSATIRRLMFPGPAVIDDIGMVRAAGRSIFGIVSDIFDRKPAAATAPEPVVLQPATQAAPLTLNIPTSPRPALNLNAPAAGASLLGIAPQPTIEEELRGRL